MSSCDWSSDVCSSDLQNSKESYACMMASVVWRNPETSLFELRLFCLKFGCFPFTRHTANNISLWLKKVQCDWKLFPIDCVTATPHGAAAMVRACILAGLPPVSVCDAHNLQQCVQYSIGFTQGSLNVHSRFTQGSLKVHSRFTQDSLNVHSRFTQRSLNVHSMFTQ